MDKSCPTSMKTVCSYFGKYVRAWSECVDSFVYIYTSLKMPKYWFYQNAAQFDIYVTVEMRT